VTDFAEQFLSKVHIQGLVQGNLTVEQVKGVDSMLRSHLKGSPLPSNSVTDIRCNGLPAGFWTVLTEEMQTLWSLIITRVAPAPSGSTPSWRPSCC
jgi:hypothetical protein